MQDEHDFADLLSGAKAIADYIGKNYRQTVYLLSTNKIPGWKIGAVWYSTKSKVRARLLGEEADPPPENATAANSCTTRSDGGAKDASAGSQSNPRDKRNALSSQASSNRGGR